LKVHGLHSSVATQLQCGGIFNNYVIANNCPLYVPVKKIENRLIFSEKMKNDKVGRFLGHSVVKYPTALQLCCYTTM